MNHSLTAEKYGVRLRPVRLEDAAFIVRLRSSPHARALIGDSAPDAAAQTLWLRRYFERAGDYYFIVELANSGVAVGTTGLYDVQADSCEWGRWVMMPGTRAGRASLWLSFYIGFEVLHLTVIRSQTVPSNERVVALQERIGNPCLGLGPPTAVIEGKPVCQLQYRATRADWPAISNKLGQEARLVQPALQCP